MAAATLTKINKLLATAGIPLELVRGEGYHYFIFDDPRTNTFETVSEYVCYTSSYTVERWVEIARGALEDIYLRAIADPEQTA